ncbi:MAG: beta-galactosidase trimerization domain-containing protein, partial [Planctomycetota bacterium]
DGVAVLYSPASMLLANLSRELPQRWDSFAGVCMIFPESNFQYRYIYPTELEAGALMRGNYRVLYLPYCQALSPKEVREIRVFVSEGGVALADLRPGVADGHGKPYERGALDDVFGVRQDTGKALASGGVVKLSGRIGAVEGELPFAMTDRSVAVAGGRALGSAGEAPAVIVNDFGAGRGILLNFAISDWVLDKLMPASHTAIRFADDESAEGAAGLIQGLLAEARVKPAVEMTPSVPGCHLYRFKKDGVLLLGLLQEIPPFLPGVGARPMDELDQISATRSAEVTLELDAERHVYDVFAGRYLGEMREVKRTVKPGVPQLLAALSYRVEGVTLALGNDAPKQGEELSITATVKTDGAPAGLHVLRLEFTDPEGKVVKEYTRKVCAEGGRWAGSIPLSLDEKPGEWKVRAYDVATGVTGEAEYRVISRD